MTARTVGEIRKEKAELMRSLYRGREFPDMDSVNKRMRELRREEGEARRNHGQKESAGEVS